MKPSIPLERFCSDNTLSAEGAVFYFIGG